MAASRQLIRSIKRHWNDHTFLRALAEQEARGVLVWDELDHQEPLYREIACIRPLLRVLPGGRKDSPDLGNEYGGGTADAVGGGPALEERTAS
jgi:hypothetical protein